MPRATRSPTLWALAASACAPGAPDGVVTPPPAPPSAVRAAASPEPAPSAPPPVRVGLDKEHPFLRCGPADAQAFVAGHRCPDGSQPLGGDARAGSAARVGNAGSNAAGHVVDRYVVACPDGEHHLFVDMYACAEWERRLRP